MKNREIKFRAWNVFMQSMIPYQKVQIEFAKWVNDDNWILMQYTGLKDKNGKEIYEGDIVNGGCFNGSYAYGRIIWYDNGWYINPIGKFLEGLDILNKNRTEVIGNIYENPELLK